MNAIPQALFTLKRHFEIIHVNFYFDKLPVICQICQNLSHQNFMLYFDPVSTMQFSKGNNFIICTYPVAGRHYYISIKLKIEELFIIILNHFIYEN